MHALCPEGELLPPRHGPRRDDEDGPGDDFPSPTGTGMVPDGFFVDTKSFDGGVEVLSLFLGFLVYIGFFSIEITPNGATWAIQAIKARPGGRRFVLWPTGGSPPVVLHSNIAYFL